MIAKSSAPGHVDWLAAARLLSADPAARIALTWLERYPDLPAPPPPAPPPGLAARPAALPPAAWHADRLRQLATADPLHERTYHARWLWHLLAPDETAARPRVAIVIPVFNRAAVIADAVQSALDQDYRPLEVIVVDDGSSDDTAGALARFGRQVQLLRLPGNRGVSAARNAGVAAAEGELVHFLDSDDRLAPEAVSLKVAALAAVADADLCFAAHSEDRQPEAGDLPVFLPPIGSPACVTQDSHGLLRRYPCLPSSVLIARPALLAIGGFDERLRRGEDSQLFFHLGVAGAKCIAVKRELLHRTLRADSLSRPPDRIGSWQLGKLLSQALLPARADLWPFASPLRERSRAYNPPDPLAPEATPVACAAAQTLLRRLDAIIEQPPGGHSPAPLLALLVDNLEPGPLNTALRERLARARRTVPPAPRDLALWGEAQLSARVAAAFREVFTAQSRALRRGEAWVSLSRLDQRPFRAIAHPAKARWKVLAWVARHLGERGALALARLIG